MRLTTVIGAEKSSTLQVSRYRTTYTFELWFGVSGGGSFQEGRCKTTWIREFKLPGREAGPTHHLDNIKWIRTSRLSIKNSILRVEAPNRD